MHRTFIALILSAAVAVTSLNAQPAHAGDDDVAKWIAGLAALAVIGVAINENKKKKRKKRRVTPVQPHNPYLLPATCRTNQKVQGYKVNGFQRGCLRRNQVNVRALPQDCAIKYWDRKRQKNRVIYSGRCLREYGYRVAQAH